MSSSVSIVRVNYAKKIYLDLTTQEVNEMYDKNNHRFLTTLNEQSLTFEPDSTLLLKNINGWEIVNPEITLDPDNNGGVYGWEYKKNENKILLVVNSEYDEAFIHSIDKLNIEAFFIDYNGLRVKDFYSNELKQYT